MSELARELGIAVTLLYKWRKEYEEFGEGSFPGNGKLKLTPGLFPLRLSLILLLL
ncbi:transposase [Chryseobacterium sp. GP-SGM7]|uniref:transposase n=1 Tax=Chryseobacterium sp. GP-SGM7 TaxID=3411323 RepID=UPI003B922F42